MSDANKQPCRNCGAELAFSPAEQLLKCPYCGTANAIQVAGDPSRAHAEKDFATAIAEARAFTSTETVIVSKCTGCAAEVDLPSNVSTDECPFCGQAITRQDAEAELFKPQGMLPFGLAKDDASARFRKWAKSRWFAPGELKRMANSHDGMKGVYLPHWTFDADTVTHYRGERGDNYTEWYTARDSDGKTVRRSRTRTRWRRVAGWVQDRFDDVLVCASQSLPRHYVEKLEPWDLTALVPIDPRYLAGFRTERYQIDLEAAFEEAAEEMRKVIDRSIRQDIGGDQQRIHDRETKYRSITFKHLLLPVWASAYRFKGKVYRFVINARTGEVQGERPWSSFKISLAVLAGLIVLGTIVYFTAERV